MENNSIDIVLDILKNRYAAQYMSDRKVDAKLINDIATAINLAPSSLGVQPYKVLIIENEDLKKKLCSEAAYGQQPVAGCSHLFIFLANKKLTEGNIDKYVTRVVETRGWDKEKAESYKGRLMNFANKVRSGGREKTWAMSQTYIAMSFGLMAAAAAGLDSVPMEGFDKDIAANVLGINTDEYVVNLFMPVGYSVPEKDYLYGAKKVRKNLDDLIEYIK